MHTKLALGLIATLGAGCGGPGAGETTSDRQVIGPQQVVVTAVEYAFEEVPASIPAGETTFRLQNEGQEPHMMFFARIEGTSKSIAELIQLSERASDRFVDEVGGIRKPVGPAENGEATLELEPGRYGYVCFVSAPDGNAHYEKGMFGELEVAA